MSSNLFKHIKRVSATLFASLLAITLTISCNSNQSGKAEDVMSQENYLKALSQYDKVDKFHEGLAIVCKDNKFGMIDTDAEEVIPCEYNKLYPCSEGIIRFRSFDNPLYGFIDKNNKKITEAIYTDARNFHEGMAVVANADADGSTFYGFIDKEGEEIIPRMYEKAGSFNSGLAPVKNDGYWGYVDKMGVIIIPIEFDNAKEFGCGVACVLKDNTPKVIDEKGSTVFTLKEGLRFLARSFSEELIPVGKEVDDDLICGYIDTEGKEVIPFNYELATNFHDGKAYVMKNEEVYSIDHKGTIIEKIEDPKIIRRVLKPVLF